MICLVSANTHFWLASLSLTEQITTGIELSKRVLPMTIVLPEGEEEGVLISDCFVFDPVGETMPGRDNAVGIKTRPKRNSDMMEPLIQLQFFFDISDVEKIDMFIHNKDQYFVPNSALFGGHKADLTFDDCDTDAGCHQYFNLKRTQWWALDYSGQRCDETDEELNTTKCLANFVRDKVGCYVPIQSMEPGRRRQDF